MVGFAGSGRAPAEGLPNPAPESPLLYQAHLLSPQPYQPLSQVGLPLDITKQLRAAQMYTLGRGLL